MDTGYLYTNDLIEDNSPYIFSSAHMVKEMGWEELYTGGVLMLRRVLIHVLQINFISKF